MKVKFKYGIATYSGTLDEMTYGNYRDGLLCIGRRWVMPTLTAHNENLGNISSNIAKVYSEVSDLYQADLKTYAKRNGRENVPRSKMPPTAYAIWIKLLWAWAEGEDPQIDLSALTIEDLETGGDKLATVADAVDNGLLKKVSNFDELTATL
ncbi:MAG: hypothetical protein U1B83_04340 [Candidatus Cloacimonadaceae bacterium]|nr:hypothetical protein [Candidatus Cloacimonadaceae bacterium]